MSDQNRREFSENNLNMLNNSQTGLHDIKSEVKRIEESITNPNYGLEEIKRQVSSILQKVTMVLDTVRPVPEERVNIVVRPGDTLSFFAQVFGVTVAEILAVNPGIVDPDEIFPGQIVSIPAAPPVGPDPGMAAAQYLVRPGDTLFVIAQQFGIGLSTLIAANPQIPDPNIIFINQVINLPVTPPAPPIPPVGTIQIYVSAGETLTSISQRTGISLQVIIDANPQIVDPDLISVGQIINIPLVTVAEDLLRIVIKPGDTLSFFARVFGITVEQILEANPGIVDPDEIFPGQIVSIPASVPVGPNPGFTTAQYLVRPGDTLFAIAQQFGLSLSSLIAVNPQIPNPNIILINQVINLPVTPPAPPIPPVGTIQIYVSVGETLTSIAQRTGVSVQTIINANPQIVDPDLISVGQIINVPRSS